MKRGGRGSEEGKGQIGMRKMTASEGKRRKRKEEEEKQRAGGMKRRKNEPGGGQQQVKGKAIEMVKRRE